MDRDIALTKLQAGMPVLIGGNKVIRVSEELARDFQPGDEIIAVRGTAELLHVRAEIRRLVSTAVENALSAFEVQRTADDGQFTRFYDEFARRLSDPDVWSEIAAANERDVSAAKARGRSTTRLAAGENMRSSMIAGLMQWRDLPSRRETVINTVEHEGWAVDEVVSPCGVVAFVFEGRPNVLADATGVLRSGNTAVFRIGSDALRTAAAIMEAALRPSLRAAGLPEAAVVLLESAEHAAGWALFSDPRLALAVARGSGRSVDILGAIAREAGNAVSLHGMGGGWIVADRTADPEKFELAVYNSLDRKVCNTVNTVCIERSAAETLVPRLLNALARRAEKLGHGFRIHAAESSRAVLPEELYNRETDVYRADGIKREMTATVLPDDSLGREWEWEQTPEITLRAVDDLDEGIELFNRQSPRLVASLLSEDPGAHRKFMSAVESPFIGNGFTRWVDGQYALLRPELGLSNWQYGRLLARSAVLTGDGVYTVKLVVRQSDPDIHR